MAYKIVVLLKCTGNVHPSFTFLSRLSRSRKEKVGVLSLPIPKKTSSWSSEHLSWLTIQPTGFTLATKMADAFLRNSSFFMATLAFFSVNALSMAKAK